MAEERTSREAAAANSGAERVEQSVGPPPRARRSARTAPKHPSESRIGTDEQHQRLQEARNRITRPKRIADLVRFEEEADSERTAG